MTMKNSVSYTFVDVFILDKKTFIALLSGKRCRSLLQSGKHLPQDSSNLRSILFFYLVRSHLFIDLYFFNSILIQVMNFFPNIEIREYNCSTLYLIVDPDVETAQSHWLHLYALICLCDVCMQVCEHS